MSPPDRMTNRIYYWRCIKLLVGYKSGQPLTGYGVFALAVAWTVLFWSVILTCCK